MSDSDLTADSFGRCHMCGGAAQVVLAGEPEVIRCDVCRLLTLREFPDRSARHALYQEEYHDAEAGHRLPGLFEVLVRGFRKLRVRSVIRREPGPASLLDVGCGRGLLLELFQRQGWRVRGTQVSNTAAEAARKIRGVEVLVGELPELSLPSKSFRVVTMFHVLEHVPDPDRYVRAIWEVLEEGGLFVVECPNFTELALTILRQRHLCIDYPHHLIFFKTCDLHDLLERHGFTVEATRHFSLEYSPFTTLQNLLNVLPGRPNRLFHSLLTNAVGRALRRSPLTWVHWILAVALAAPAFCLSLLGLLFPCGNTVRFYCRKRTHAADVEEAEPCEAEVAQASEGLALADAVPR